MDNKIVKMLVNAHMQCSLSVAKILMYFNVTLRRIQHLIQRRRWEGWMFQYVGLQIEHRQVFLVVGKDNISRNVHGRFSVQMLMGGRPCRIHLNTVCHVLNVSSGMGFTCYVAKSNAQKCLPQTVTKYIVSIDVSIYLFFLHLATCIHWHYYYDIWGCWDV